MKVCIRLYLTKLCTFNENKIYVCICSRLLSSPQRNLLIKTYMLVLLRWTLIYPHMYTYFVNWNRILIAYQRDSSDHNTQINYVAMKQ